ncbi:MAG: sugar ABC transporter substrate-binding protein [Pyrinomonadaceae bacterium]
MSQSATTNEHPPATVYNPPPRLDEMISKIPLVGAKTAPAKIGYLTNYSFHIWYQIVIEVLNRRGKQYGTEIVVRDAELSVEKQIEQARTLVNEVDALILTPADTNGLEEIIRIADEAGKPLLIEANPVNGMKTMVAICDYDAGFDMGVWVGNNIRNEDRSPLRILDVGLPWLRPCLLRSQGFVKGVQSVQSDAFVVASINGEATPSVAKKITSETLLEKGDVDLIFAMDDETAQGAFQGYLEAGFDADSVTIAGFGLSGEAEKDWLMRREALKVSAAMFPEYVGLRCVDGVIDLVNGRDVPLRDVTPTIPITADLLEKYYTKNDGVWTPNFEAIESIPRQSDCTET